MNRSTKLLLKSFSVIVTLVLIYFLAPFFLPDLAVSVEPGWHTAVYPPKFIAISIISTIALLVLAYFVFKYLLKLLIFIWLKVFSLHP